MKVTRAQIPDVLVLEPARHGDRRGFFSETFNRRLYQELGVSCEFVQDNHSLSQQAGVLRGLHYQAPPMAQDKLVRCVRGSILDVAVDIRRGSPTFSRWVGEVLSAENWRQMFVPKGFAHGFVTLEPNTEVCYKVSEYYSPEHDRGLRFDDPDVGVDWRMPASEATLSDRDRRHPGLAESEACFEYGRM